MDDKCLTQKTVQFRRLTIQFTISGFHEVNDVGKSPTPEKRVGSSTGLDARLLSVAIWVRVPSGPPVFRFKMKQTNHLRVYGEVSWCESSEPGQFNWDVE